MTSYNKLLNKIDNLELGETISRQELRQGITDSSDISSTLDMYRRMLTLVGVLETVKPGLYKKTSPVNLYISSTQLREVAYDKHLTVDYIRNQVYLNLISLN